MNKMGFSLFKRNVEPGRVPGSMGVTPIYDVLMNGLSEMDRKGVDRLVLTLYDSEPEIIRGHKHYTIISLVRANVGGVRTYPNRGLEVFQRTAVNPFLPQLKLESNLRYITRGGYVGEEDLNRYLEESGAVGTWTPESIEQVVNVGIQEYQETTKRLMKDAGVHDSLRNMKQRQSPFEQIMVNMRTSINLASKKEL